MKKKTKITNETLLYFIGWILLLVFALGTAAVKLWPELFVKYTKPCLFQLFTGFYCPGCGGTRAVFSLLRGKVLPSLVQHPFVLYVAVVGGWFMISQTIERLSKGRIRIAMKYRGIYLWIGLGLVVINFLVKNLFLLWGVDLIALAARNII